MAIRSIDNSPSNPANAAPKPPVKKLVNLGPEMIRLAMSFMTWSERAKFDQVAKFTRGLARDLPPSLSAKIQALPVGTISNEDFKRLLVELITCPAAGPSPAWVDAMDALMAHSPFEKPQTMDEGVDEHAKLAGLLETPKTPISSEKIYHFCKYLAANKIFVRYAWVGYRALEQYLQKPNLNAESIRIAIKEYLAVKTKSLGSNEYTHTFSKERELRVQQIRIYSIKWFGHEGVNASLWNQPGAVGLITIPEPVLEALWAHIKSQRDLYAHLPFAVYMMGSSEAELPFNFTLPLAQRITGAQIYLESNETVDKTKLDKAYSGEITNRGSYDVLAAQYPAAVLPNNASAAAAP